MLLYFYQDGCPCCTKLLADNSGNRAIADKAQRAFDVVAIDLWGDRDVTDLAGAGDDREGLRCGAARAVHADVAVLDGRGRVVLRINGYFPPHEFDVALGCVASRHEQTQDFRAYYAAVVPVAARTVPKYLAEALEPPLRLAERAMPQRHLLVLVEQRKTKPQRA